MNHKAGRQTGHHTSFLRLQRMLALAGGLLVSSSSSRFVLQRAKNEEVSGAVRRGKEEVMSKPAVSALAVRCEGGLDG